MQELLWELEKLGFSKVEAAVYITLVKEGDMTGYQIAKILNMARSSVYPVLDTLYKMGYIFLIQGETNIYSAQEPDILMEQLKNNYLSSIKKAKDEMKKLKKTKKDSRYINIEGYQNIIQKAKELILTAEKEVYINTEIDLTLFKKEFNEVSKKGVRIIVYSWKKHEINGLPVEFFCREAKNELEMRLMIVTDMKRVLIASREKDENEEEDREEELYIGTFTDNKFLSSLVAEHIHFDIYLMKLEEKYGKSLIEKEILIKTMLEMR